MRRFDVAAVLLMVATLVAVGLLLLAQAYVR